MIFFTNIKKINIYHNSFFKALVMLALMLSSVSNSFANSDPRSVAGITPLMQAVTNNDISGVSFFAKSAKEDINKQNYGGATALSLAARSGNIEIVKVLLEYGADVNSADNEGWTAIMRSASFGFSDVLDVLIDAGAEIDKVNSNDETLLEIAVNSNCINCITVVLDAAINDKIINSKSLQANVSKAFALAQSRNRDEIKALFQNRVDQISDLANQPKLYDTKSVAEKQLPKESKKDKLTIKKDPDLVKTSDSFKSQDLKYDNEDKSKLQQFKFPAKRKVTSEKIKSEVNDKKVLQPKIKDLVNKEEKKDDKKIDKEVSQDFKFNTGQPKQAKKQKSNSNNDITNNDNIDRNSKMDSATKDEISKSFKFNKGQDHSTKEIEQIKDKEFLNNAEPSQVKPDIKKLETKPAKKYSIKEGANKKDIKTPTIVPQTLQQDSKKTDENLVEPATKKIFSLDKGAVSVPKSVQGVSKNGNELESLKSDPEFQKWQNQANKQQENDEKAKKYSIKKGANKNEPKKELVTKPTKDIKQIKEEIESNIKKISPDLKKKDSSDKKFKFSKKKPQNKSNLKNSEKPSIKENDLKHSKQNLPKSFKINKGPDSAIKESKDEVNIESLKNDEAYKRWQSKERNTLVKFKKDNKIKSDAKKYEDIKSKKSQNFKFIKKTSAVKNNPVIKKDITPKTINPVKKYSVKPGSPKQDIIKDISNIKINQPTESKINKQSISKKIIESKPKEKDTSAKNFKFSKTKSTHQQSLQKPEIKDVSKKFTIKTIKTQKAQYPIIDKNDRVTNEEAKKFSFSPQSSSKVDKTAKKKYVISQDKELITKEYILNKENAQQSIKKFSFGN